MTIAGSVALVTGANGGIGRSLVAELLKRGAAKVYVAARNPSSLQPILAEGGARLVPLTLDVTDPDQVRAAAEAASDVTLLINNAGYAALQGALADGAIANLRQEFEVNCIGPLDLTRAFVPGLTKAGGGTIVNVLSFLSLVTMPLAGTYSATKAAALAISRSLQAELATRGVAVLAAMPVAVDTDMGKWQEGPKVAPAEAASDILDAVEAGQTEVFPGALSREAAANFRADPAAVQAYLSKVLPPQA